MSISLERESVGHLHFGTHLLAVGGGGGEGGYHLPVRKSGKEVCLEDTSWCSRCYRNIYSGVRNLLIVRIFVKSILIISGYQHNCARFLLRISKQVRDTFASCMIMARRSVVNECRYIFAALSHSPPTLNALGQHAKPAVYVKMFVERNYSYPEAARQVKTLLKQTNLLVPSERKSLKLKHYISLYLSALWVLKIYVKKRDHFLLRLGKAASLIPNCLSKCM